jgi:AhpD family alkylhydroperoxidase
MNDEKKPASEAASLYSPAVAELVAIGAAIAANCEPCFEYHYAQAKKLGVCPRDMARAVAMAQAVKEAPARSILALAKRTLGCSASPQEAGAPTEGTCCGPEKTPAQRKGGASGSGCCNAGRSHA